jgi:4'-phosphopantetheinyl transferase
MWRYYHVVAVELVCVRRPKRLPERARAAALASLPADERTRILRYRRPEDADASLLGWLLLARLGEGARFVRSARGRPVAERGRDANVSHSGELVAAAATTRGLVGVDVEAVRTVREGVAERCFTDDERAWIARARPAGQAARFFRLWTLKEAYVKATGVGIAADLQAISFEIRSPHSATVSVAGERGEARRWHFRSWALPGQESGVMLSVCTEDADLPRRPSWLDAAELLDRATIAP